MSTLVIGGLFVLALIALVALVFVLRSEPRAANTVPETSSNEPVVSETSASLAIPVVSANSQANTSTTTDTIEPTIPATPSPVEESHFAMANGQFHELSVELHTLHEQSQEIEHRLSVLSEIIERIERSQDAHIAAEYSPTVDRPSIN